ncbi:MAG: 23S rRNA (adenine(2030)-N(6))-methyltransferase RlmJ [Opitutus sp.]|nr:23S rRNA (adenine(2030)-N(6))-methyltransferase RlmJ [Opitutus sp.]
MNYRHHFHAGNFADVMKHVLLRQLLRALQKKEKGFLYLDTHAGRGDYDLTAATVGDSLARRPEFSDGIGRLLPRADLPPALADYVAAVQEFDRRGGNLTEGPRLYPGSPWLARRLARPQERLVFCEKHPAECAALRDGAGLALRVTVHEMDGYAALRAMLPPLERRALVLIDPPYEAADEQVQIVRALGEALRRMGTGVFAVWYPLTERARVDEFFAALRALKLPPTLAMELAIAGESSAIKMRGCGLVVVNPPWQFDREAEPLLAYMAGVLAQAPGGGSRLEWINRG